MDCFIVDVARAADKRNHARAVHPPWQGLRMSMDAGMANNRLALPVP